MIFEEEFDQKKHLRIMCNLDNPNSPMFAINEIEQSNQLETIKGSIWHTPQNEDELENEQAEQPCGLVNLGATCYLNSLLQAFYFNTSVRHAIFESQSEQLMELKRLYGNMSIAKTASPKAFAEAAKLESNEQEDVSEFLSLWIDFLSRQSDKLKKVISKNYEGESVYSTYLKCGCKREPRSQPYVSLQVPMNNFPMEGDDFISASASGKEETEKKKNVLLTDLMEKNLFGTEELCGDNQVTCDECQIKTDATRSLRLKTIPPHLYVEVLRYSYTPEGNREKCNSPLEFPERLDLSPWTEPHKPKQAGNQLNLVGMLLHHGDSALHGHYSAHIKIDDKWWELNDEEVAPLDSMNEENEDITVEETGRMFENTTAYLLIYARDTSNKSVGKKDDLTKMPEWLQTELQNTKQLELVEAEEARAAKEQLKLEKIKMGIEDYVCERKKAYGRVIDGMLKMMPLDLPLALVPSNWWRDWVLGADIDEEASEGLERTYEGIMAGFRCVHNALCPTLFWQKEVLAIPLEIFEREIKPYLERPWVKLPTPAGVCDDTHNQPTFPQESTVPTVAMEMDEDASELLLPSASSSPNVRKRAAAAQMSNHTAGLPSTTTNDGGSPSSSQSPLRKSRRLLANAEKPPPSGGGTATAPKEQKQQQLQSPQHPGWPRGAHSPVASLWPKRRRCREEPGMVNDGPTSGREYGDKNKGRAAVEAGGGEGIPLRDKEEESQSEGHENGAARGSSQSGLKMNAESGIENNPMRSSTSSSSSTSIIGKRKKGEEETFCFSTKTTDEVCMKCLRLCHDMGGNLCDQLTIFKSMFNIHNKQQLFPGGGAPPVGMIKCGNSLIRGGAGREDGRIETSSSKLVAKKQVTEWRQQMRDIHKRLKGTAVNTPAGAGRVAAGDNKLSAAGEENMSGNKEDATPNASDTNTNQSGGENKLNNMSENMCVSAHNNTSTSSGGGVNIKSSMERLRNKNTTWSSTGGGGGAVNNKSSSSGGGSSGGGGINTPSNSKSSFEHVMNTVVELIAHSTERKLRRGLLLPKDTAGYHPPAKYKHIQGASTCDHGLLTREVLTEVMSTDHLWHLVQNSIDMKRICGKLGIAYTAYEPKTLDLLPGDPAKQRIQRCQQCRGVKQSLLQMKENLKKSRAFYMRQPLFDPIFNVTSTTNPNPSTLNQRKRQQGVCLRPGSYSVIPHEWFETFHEWITKVNDDEKSLPVDLNVSCYPELLCEHEKLKYDPTEYFRDKGPNPSWVTKKDYAHPHRLLYHLLPTDEMVRVVRTLYMQSRGAVIDCETEDNAFMDYIGTAFIPAMLVSSAGALTTTRDPPDADCLGDSPGSNNNTPFSSYSMENDDDVCQTCVVRGFIPFASLHVDICLMPVGQKNDTRSISTSKPLKLGKQICASSELASERKEKIYNKWPSKVEPPKFLRLYVCNKGCLVSPPKAKQKTDPGTRTDVSKHEDDTTDNNTDKDDKNEGCQRTNTKRETEMEDIESCKSAIENITTCTNDSEMGGRTGKDDEHGDDGDGDEKAPCKEKTGSLTSSTPDPRYNSTTSTSNTTSTSRKNEDLIHNPHGNGAITKKEMTAVSESSNNSNGPSSGVPRIGLKKEKQPTTPTPPTTGPLPPPSAAVSGAPNHGEEGTFIHYRQPWDDDMPLGLLIVEPLNDVYILVEWDDDNFSHGQVGSCKESAAEGPGQSSSREAFQGSVFRDT